MYRYLLQTNEQPLISLQEELQFMDAYYHLLQTRFEDAFIVEIVVDTKLLRYQLPPLTLQLLRKCSETNSIDADHPLKVTITATEETGIVICN